MKSFLVLAVFAGLFLFQFADVVNGQEGIRWVHQFKPTFRNPAIEVIGYEIQGNSFTGYGMADADWLEDLTLIVKNISAKNIKSISIMLGIPQQGNMEANYAFSYRFDHRQAQKDESEGSISAAASSMLKPGATLKLTTYKPHALNMLKFAREKGVFDIRDVDLWLMEVRFDDGTGKAGGTDAVEDADGNLRIVKPNQQPQ